MKGKGHYKAEAWIDKPHSPGKIRSHPGQGNKVGATKRTGKEVGGATSYTGHTKGGKGY